MAKLDGMRVAADFLALDPDNFRMFWGVIHAEWNDEDSDLEAFWFYTGSHMKPRETSVISAMLSALSSGQRERAHD